MTILIIVACSIIHSIFGVGLLVFGTPIFLLLGHTYSETLWIVLPPSMAINAFQIWSDRNLIERPRKFFVWFVFPTAICAIISLRFLSDMNIRKVVGVMLVISAILRFSPLIQEFFKNLVKKRLNLFVIIIGTIHGLTNMGGGFLTTMMATVHRSKESFRVNVAFGYFTMALIQLSIILWLEIGPANFPNIFLNITVAVLTYEFLGKWIYQKVGGQSFQHAITALILSFGVILLA